MENKQLKDLIAKSSALVYDRNLQTQDPNKQFLKLYEEIGELSRGLAENDEAVTKTALEHPKVSARYLDSVQLSVYGVYRDNVETFVLSVLALSLETN